MNDEKKNLPLFLFLLPIIDYRTSFRRALNTESGATTRAPTTVPTGRPRVRQGVFIQRIHLCLVYTVVHSSLSSLFYQYYRLLAKPADFLEPLSVDDCDHPFIGERLITVEHAGGLGHVQQAAIGAQIAFQMAHAALLYDLVSE